MSCYGARSVPALVNAYWWLFFVAVLSARWLSLGVLAASDIRVITLDSTQGFRGEFKSPTRNGSDYYPPDMHCQFQFRAPPNYVVRLAWTRFNLLNEDYETKQCLTDFVTIVVIDYHQQQHVSARLCGSSIPPDLMTMQRWVDVIFETSMAQHDYLGFAGTYEFIKEEDISVTPSIWPGKDDPERAGCGGVVSRKNAHGGIITSPGYPHTYPKDVQCTWLIRVALGKKIFVKLMELQLTETQAYHCKKAHLLMVDGYAHYLETRDELLPPTQRVEFCGEKKYYKKEQDEVSYMSEQNRLLIKFNTTAPPPQEVLVKHEQTGAPVGFFIIWTEVSVNEPECDGFVCRGGEYCIREGIRICGTRTRYCIDKSLLCDGVNNCGSLDNSDEENCRSMEIIIVCCCLFLLVIVLLTVLVCCHRQCKRRHERIRHAEKEENYRTAMKLTAEHDNRNDHSALVDGPWQHANSVEPFTSGLKQLDQSPSNRYKRVQAQAQMALPAYRRIDKDSHAKEPFLGQNHVHPHPNIELQQRRLPAEGGVELIPHGDGIEDETSLILWAPVEDTVRSKDVRAQKPIKEVIEPLNFEFPPPPYIIVQDTSTQAQAPIKDGRRMVHDSTPLPPVPEESSDLERSPTIQVHRPAPPSSMSYPSSLYDSSVVSGHDNAASVTANYVGATTPKSILKNSQTLGSLREPSSSTVDAESYSTSTNGQQQAPPAPPKPPYPSAKLLKAGERKLPPVPPPKPHIVIIKPKVGPPTSHVTIDTRHATIRPEPHLAAPTSALQRSDIPPPLHITPATHDASPEKSPSPWHRTKPTAV